MAYPPTATHNRRRRDQITDTKKPAQAISLTGFSWILETLQRVYVLCLGSFEAFTDGEFNLLAFLQSLTAVADDLTEVNENIAFAFTGYKSKTFFVVEPFNGSGNLI
jgi:hypothetical protein